MQTTVSTTTTRSPRRLPIVALLVANAISFIGSALSMVALPWFVLQTTGSAAQTGLTAFFQLLPLVLGGFLGGALVDRFGFKRTSVGADALSGAAVALVPLLYQTVGLEQWQLLTLVFVSTLCNIPGGTARQSMLPDLAALAGLPLERANAASEAIRRFSQLLGPAVAGLLITMIGSASVLWLDAASFGLSALIVLGMLPALGRRGTASRRYLADLREGLGFLRQDRLVRALIVVITASNLLLNPVFIVILPVYARGTSGSSLDLGLMIAGFGGGTLLSTLLFGAFGPRLPRRALLVTLQIATGLPLWLLAAPLPSVAMVGLLFVMGLALGPLGPLAVTVLGERTPEALRGRVFGAFGALANMGIPFSVLVAGYLVEAAGVRATLLGLAGAFQALSLCTLLMPVFHQLAARGQGSGARGQGPGEQLPDPRSPIPDP